MPHAEHCRRVQPGVPRDGATTPLPFRRCVGGPGRSLHQVRAARAYHIRQWPEFAAKATKEWLGRVGPKTLFTSQAAHVRTAISSHSMSTCATSCQMVKSSTPSTKLASSPDGGGTITTKPPTLCLGITSTRSRGDMPSEPPGSATLCLPSSLASGGALN